MVLGRIFSDLGLNLQASISGKRHHAAHLAIFYFYFLHSSFFKYFFLQNFANDYPSEPLKMQFATEVWHPNKNGTICLEDYWSPALTLKATLISAQALHSASETRQPQKCRGSTIVLQRLPNIAGQARHWTEAFFISSLGDEEMVHKLVKMSFP